MTGDESKAAVQEALWRLLGKRNALNPSGLVARVVRESGLDPLDVQRALATLLRECWLEGVSDRGEPFAQVRILVKPLQLPTPATLVAWRNAMQAAGMSEADMQALDACHEALLGVTAADLQAVATGLMGLRERQAQWRGTASFVVSARNLLGSAKLLSALPAKRLNLFGLAENGASNTSRYVIVGAPRAPEAVLLIENPDAFENAIAAGLARSIAVIVTFGYGLTRAGDAFGNQLAEMVEAGTERMVALVREGAPPPLRTLFCHERLFFWGDLDAEGLRIYARLRKRLPALRLSALYGQMVEALRAGAGHPYTDATGKATQRALNEREELPDDARELLPLCVKRGLDQEWLEIEHYIHLASKQWACGTELNHELTGIGT
jgi:hypothetical protein